MGLINLASGASLWRGYDYYKSQSVISSKKMNDSEYSGEIKGTGDDPYHVSINTDHPRKSKCNCPHADGRRVICKHMIALYFTVFPNEAENLIAEAEEYEEEEQKRQQEEYENIEKYVNSLSKQQLRNALITYMVEDNQRGY